MSVTLGWLNFEIRGKNWELEVTPRSIFFDSPKHNLYIDRDQKELLLTQVRSDGVTMETEVAVREDWVGVWREPSPAV